MSLLKVNEVQNYNGSSLTLTASTVSTSAQLNTGGNVSVTGSINVSDDSTTRSNLGLGTMATQAANSVDIDGGAIDGTTIGGTSAAAGTFTTFTSNGIDDNASSTALTIDSSGRVKINTDSVVGILNVDNDNNEPVMMVISSDTSNRANPGIIIQKQDNDNTTVQTYISFNYNAGASGAGGIQGDGSNGVQFYSSSDIRLKENILDLSSELPNILSLQPRTFDFIDGPTDCIGFIADEVELIYPEMVSVNENDGYKTLGGISRFDTRLVKAIQEQQAIIESQQSQIDALTARIEALETA